MEILSSLQDSLKQQRRNTTAEQHASYNSSFDQFGDLKKEKIAQLTEAVQALESRLVKLFTYGGMFTPTTLTFSIGTDYHALLPKLESTLLNISHFVVTKNNNSQDLTCYIHPELKNSISVRHNNLSTISKRQRGASSEDVPSNNAIGLADAIGETLITACEALGFSFEDAKLVLYDLLVPLPIERLEEVFTQAETKQGKPLTETQKVQLVKVLLANDQRAATQMEPGRYGFLLAKRALEQATATNK